MRNILPILLTLGTLSACSDRGYDQEEPVVEGPEALENPAARETDSPPPQPVRIGEGGPRFDACQAVGRVQGRGALDVLAAPFDDAEQVDQLAEGQNVWICTRSIDQQWFGIVYDEEAGTPEPRPDENGVETRNPPPAMIPSRGPGDCGVSSPVRSKRVYDGPCKSGWVESTFVRLIAG